MWPSSGDSATARKSRYVPPTLEEQWQEGFCLPLINPLSSEEAKDPNTVLSSNSSHRSQNNSPYDLESNSGLNSLRTPRSVNNVQRNAGGKYSKGSAKYVDKGSRAISNSSKITTKNAMKPSEDYMKVIGRERPLAVFIYVVFVLLCPLVFRYGLSSGDRDQSKTVLLPEVGNGTVVPSTVWENCQSCEGFSGITLAEVVVEVTNVTNPNAAYGFPSIALFASQDLETW